MKKKRTSLTISKLKLAAKDDQEKLDRLDAAEDTAAALDDAMALEVVANSEGGKLLVDAHIADALSDIESLMTNYAKLDMQGFVALCADLSNKVNIVRTLTRARKNVDILNDQLKEALQE